jgi:hypothetical protein
LCLAAAPAAADDWKQVFQTCQDARQSGQTSAPGGAQASASIFDPGTLSAALVAKPDSRYAWEDCGLQIFSADPVAIAFGSVGPASGFGVGAKTRREINSGRVQSAFVARGLIGVSGSYFAEARYDVHMPTIGQWNPATATIDDQITLSVFARRRDLRSQPFYGLGPGAPANKTTYRDERNEAGVTAYVPLARWLDAGGGIAWLAPTVTGIVDPQTQTSTEPAFVDSQALVRVHTPSATNETWNRHDVRLTFDQFSDLGSGANAFRRMQAFAIGSYELRRDIDSIFNRSAMQNFLCEPIVGRQCRFGTLVLDGLVSVAAAGAGRTIPFYLQDTLGGTDANGLDTLRGYDDFRFRAPARMLLQAEFYKGVWGPVGVYAFGDAGKVAERAADLGIDHVLGDYGPGIFLRAGGNIVLRAYVGYGGEGVHWSAKFSSAF